jgi:hypothetical protein
MPSAAPNLTPERVMQFVFGFAPPMIIETALRLGVFDVLEREDKTVEELVAETPMPNCGSGCDSREASGAAVR